MALPSSKKYVTGTALALFSLSSCAVLIILSNRRSNLTKHTKNDGRDEKGKNEEGNETKETKKVTKDYSHLPPHIQRQMRKEEQRKAKLSYLSMKSPMYDNIRMLDPQGELLCTISKKKAKWYIQKTLAKWTDEKENTIQLFFEPKNRSNRGETGVYVRSDKFNQCVACGNTEHHMRHYVVPFAYRTLFPKKFKTHLSHDIVILCPKCHVFCDQQRQLRMRDLEDQFRKQGEERKYQPYLTDSRLYHLSKVALALLRSRDKLPEEKINQYESLVREYLCLANDTKLTEEQIKNVVNIEYKKENPEYVSGPELVIAALDQDDEKIEEFVKGWRTHFLEIMRPKFLPKGWGINSSVICGAD